MLKQDEKQKLYALLDGILGAIVDRPETTDLFAVWDTVLAVKAKSKQLARAQQHLTEVQGARSRRALADARRAYADAQANFASATAGPDRWSTKLLPSADDHIRRFGFPPQRMARDWLAFHLEDRFIRKAAADGGWPFPPSQG